MSHRDLQGRGSDVESLEWAAAGAWEETFASFQGTRRHQLLGPQQAATVEKRHTKSQPRNSQGANRPVSLCLAEHSRHLTALARLLGRASGTRDGSAPRPSATVCRCPPQVAQACSHLLVGNSSSPVTSSSSSGFGFGKHCSVLESSHTRNTRAS